jgi:site-specific recombinase XerD
MTSMQYGKATRNGAHVVKHTAKNGITSFTLRYRDTTGQRVRERLGTDREGWTVGKARNALEQRLVDVRRDGYRRPHGTTFAEVAVVWLATYPTTKGLKRTTRAGYRTIVENYLIPYLGGLLIEQVDVTALDRYVADRLKDGLGPGTVNRQLNVISLVVRSARKQGLVRTNPVELVDRPKEPQRKWRILSPDEIARVRVAFDALQADAESDEESAWIRQCSQMFVFMYATGLRRGELLGLRWGRVLLADPAGPVVCVEETYVADAWDTPKSKASLRTISLGRTAAEVLFQRYADTAFQDDDDRVFCHPHTGGPFDKNDYAKMFRVALRGAKVNGRVRPFHDGRHSAITSAAAAGVHAAALQANAGHADMSTTQKYIDLAGVRFKAEAELADERMFGRQQASDE